MKKLILVLLVPVLAHAQSDCDNYPSLGISYIFPKGLSAEGAYFFGNRMTAGIGLAYSHSSFTIDKTRVNDNETEGSLNIFAYAGYRVLQVNYVVSAYLNAGYFMGNVNGVHPFVSSKILFPAGTKAIGIEPFYVFNKGMSARASIYFKL